MNTLKIILICMTLNLVFGFVPLIQSAYNPDSGLQALNMLNSTTGILNTKISPMYEGKTSNDFISTASINVLSGMDAIINMVLFAVFFLGIVIASAVKAPFIAGASGNTIDLLLGMITFFIIAINNLALFMTVYFVIVNKKVD